MGDFKHRVFGKGVRESERIRKRKVLGNVEDTE